MSAIAGECRFGGEPADGSAVRRMLDSLSHRGSARGVHSLAGAALGCAASGAAGNPLAQDQPLWDPAAGVLLVLDGRIDNGDELRAALASCGCPARSSTDAEVVLRAYQAWGTACAARLLGDFAFALWDTRHLRLVAARDVFGIKPFYYRAAAGVLQFASEPRPVTRDRRGTIRPNAGMVAEHLAGIVTSRAETLVDGLFRLPPAHVLTADARGVAVRRYWQIDPELRIQYRDDAEYEQHFRELFAEAVRCRTRGAGPIGVMLSGGLDSSSILGQVQELAARHTGAVSTTETFSLTCPGRACDEAAFIADVVQQWRPVAHVCPEHPLHWVAIARDEAARSLDAPTYPNNSAADPLRSVIRDRGCSIVLSGLGGDEWFRGSASRYADLLANLRLPALARQIWEDAAGADFVGWRAAARLAIWPLIPGPMQRLVKAAVRRDVTPRSLDAAFATRTSLRERLRRVDRDGRFRDVARREILCEALSGEAIRAFEQVDRSAAWFGFEERHPFHDRRLVQFAFAIPPDQHWRNGWPKSLMRRALGHLLPASVLARRGRPDYSHFVIDAIEAHGRAGFFDRMVAAEMGWIEPGAVRRAYDETRTHAGGRRWLWPLWAVCAVEHWARAAFDPVYNQALSTEEIVYGGEVA